MPSIKKMSILKKWMLLITTLKNMHLMVKFRYFQSICKLLTMLLYACQHDDCCQTFWCDVDCHFQSIHYIPLSSCSVEMKMSLFTFSYRSISNSRVERCANSCKFPRPQCDRRRRRSMTAARRSATSNVSRRLDSGSRACLNVQRA